MPSESSSWLRETLDQAAREVQSWPRWMQLLAGCPPTDQERLGQIKRRAWRQSPMPVASAIAKEDTEFLLDYIEKLERQLELQTTGQPCSIET